MYHNAVYVKYAVQPICHPLNWNWFFSQNEHSSSNFSFFGGINKRFHNISFSPLPRHCEDQETDGKANFIINSLANTLEIDQS